MENIEISNLTELSTGINLNTPAAISKIENGPEYEILTDSDKVSYADYLNMSKVLEVLAEFFDVNACATAKENQLCAVALGSSGENALEKISQNDPLSLMGSSIGFTKEISVKCAKILKSMNIGNIVAPGFEKEALEILQKTETNIVQIKSPLQELLGFPAKDVRLTCFGYLISEQNRSKLTKSSFKVAGKIKPTQQQAEDAIFAWKIAKHTTNRSAVIAKDLATVAIVSGMKDETSAAETAVDIACENSKDAVLATDGAVESEQTINAAIQGRIGLIIDAANGVNSVKIAKLAEKYGICFIATGIRNNGY